jgi:predicted Zn-dependent protease with MMP-like domain
MPYNVSEEEFADAVEQALAEVPAKFEAWLEEVAIEVVAEPTPQQKRRTGTRSGMLLLGLYQGRPLTERSVTDSGTMPDVIWIFQNNIQRVSGNRKELIAQIRTTVLHEIGHHFGLSEKDLRDLGYG